MEQEIDRIAKSADAAVLYKVRSSVRPSSPSPSPPEGGAAFSPSAPWTQLPPPPPPQPPQKTQALHVINRLAQELDIHAAVDAVRAAALDLLDCDRVTLYTLVESRRELVGRTGGGSGVIAQQQARVRGCGGGDEEEGGGGGGGGGGGAGGNNNSAAGGVDVPIRLRYGEGVAGYVAVSGETVNLRDAYEDSVAAEAAEAEEEEEEEEEEEDAAAAAAAAAASAPPPTAPPASAAAAAAAPEGGQPQPQPARRRPGKKEGPSPEGGGGGGGGGHHHPRPHRAAVHFNRAVDSCTGYRTRSLLCCPIRDATGKTIAVLQALNKKGGGGSGGGGGSAAAAGDGDGGQGSSSTTTTGNGVFTATDELLLHLVGVHLGNALTKSRLAALAERERERLAALGRCFKRLGTEAGPGGSGAGGGLRAVLDTVTAAARELVRAEQAVVFLADGARGELWTTVVVGGGGSGTDSGGEGGGDGGGQDGGVVRTLRAKVGEGAVGACAAERRQISLCMPLGVGAAAAAAAGAGGGGKAAATASDPMLLQLVAALGWPPPAATTTATTTAAAAAAAPPSPPMCDLLLQPVLDPSTGACLAVLVALHACGPDGARQQLHHHHHHHHHHHTHPSLFDEDCFSEGDREAMAMLSREVADVLSARSLEVSFASALSVVASRSGANVAAPGLASRLRLQLLDFGDAGGPRVQAAAAGAAAASRAGGLMMSPLMARWSSLNVPLPRAGLTATAAAANGGGAPAPAPAPFASGAAVAAAAVTMRSRELSAYDLALNQGQRDAARAVATAAAAGSQGGRPAGKEALLEAAAEARAATSPAAQGSGSMASAAGGEAWDNHAAATAYLALAEASSMAESEAAGSRGGAAAPPTPADAAAGVNGPPLSSSKACSLSRFASLQHHQLPALSEACDDEDGAGGAGAKAPGACRPSAAFGGGAGLGAAAAAARPATPPPPLPSSAAEATALPPAGATTSSPPPSPSRPRGQQQHHHQSLRDWALDCSTLPRERLVRLAASVLSLSAAARGYPLPEPVIGAFLSAVASHYRDRDQVPYHNLGHVVQVLHTVWLLLETSPSCRAALKPVDELCLLVAALCHDLDHDGRSNAFHVNAATELALRYNDRSVMENHHCALTFAILRSRAGQGVFAGFGGGGGGGGGGSGVGGNNSEDLRFARRAICEAILSTDMVGHFALTRELQDHGPNFSAGTDADRLLLIRVLLHAADVGNPVRAFGVAVRWSARVHEEFSAQARLERRMGLPVTAAAAPLGGGASGSGSGAGAGAGEDEAPPSRHLHADADADEDADAARWRASMETHFIDYVVAPLWERLAQCFAPEMAPRMAVLRENRDRFAAIAGGQQGDEGSG
jgi:GAF domain-containing protein